MNNDLTQARKLIKQCLETSNPYLELGHCGITDLNDLPELFECTHLETLILSNCWWDLEGRKNTESHNKGRLNQLSSIPLEIVKLKNLLKLKINGEIGHKWKITDTGFLEKLRQLQDLDISYNQISDFKVPEKPTGLNTLNLGSNPISNFSFLQKLTRLHTLNLAHNPISDISFLQKLTRLHSLDLGYNQISDISFLQKLTRLHSLDLGYNQISDISFLQKLTGLNTLYLHSNEISDISFLQKLTRLHTLNLGSNQISDISFLQKLTRLNTLDLGYNQISDIRVAEKFTRLHSLDLGYNQIREIPSPIVQFDMKINLEQYGTKGLVLYGNPIESPPLEILKQGRQSALDWYKATKRRLDEIKIILIGDPKAGKTSILRRLKSDAFDENEVQTDGINIEDIRFGNCKTFKKQKVLHKLTGHFWDFGGQEIMNATHQFFLTNRSVYVLVLDARKDIKVSAQVREWVRRIKATGGNSSIIIIANQIDVNQGFGFDNEYELQKEFPQIKYFIKASCKTGANIDEIKTCLAELIPQAELFSTPIDERWIGIKERLQDETHTKKFLNETRFLEICREFELTKRQGQKNAITFLHDLGLVLHFEDVNLSEYYVLDPYWITYGVYQILTSAYAGENNGIVSMNKLEFIVNEEEDKKESYHTADFKRIEYSPNQRLFLVEILNQFKLCFYLQNRKQFIIPDLLGTSEPNEVTESVRNAENSIRFVYEYEYLPNSIIPHIMVDAHELVMEKWRTGCVLEKETSRALVTSYQNKISIIVTGTHKKKREFMSVLRHLIDSINQDLSDKPSMLIPLPGVNDYADYEVLLIREKRGKPYYIFDEDKPTEKQFEISKLLEGIPSQEEVSNKDLMVELKKATAGIEDIKNRLDFHYQYLVSLPENIKIKDDISGMVKEMNAQQTEQITGEIMTMIASAFELHQGDMDEKLNKIYTDLKESADVQMKLKLSVPFINLLGINLETELDVKSWATKMYAKHELKIFKLMGHL